MDTKLLIQKLRDYPLQAETILRLYGTALKDFVSGVLSIIDSNQIELQELDCLVSLHLDLEEYAETFINLVKDMRLDAVNRSASLCLVFRTNRGQRFFEDLKISEKAELAFPWVYPMVRLAKIERPGIPGKMISAVLTWYIKEGALTEIVNCVEYCRRAVNANVLEVYKTFFEECDTNYCDNVICILQSADDISKEDIAKLRNETVQ
jgi:hypothetical protein